LYLGGYLAESGDEVLIHNLSVTGFLIETSADLTCGETLHVELPEGGPLAASVVWQRGQFYGCQFAVQAPASMVSAAALRSAIVPSRSQTPSGATFDEDGPDGADDEETQALRARMLVIFGLIAALWLLASMVVISLI